jgi:hypothetical protein
MTPKNSELFMSSEVTQFISLLQKEEVYNIFKQLVHKVLTDPDFYILKRLSNIETHLGADESYCIIEDLFNEDKEPMQPLLEQVSVLSTRIDDSSLPVLKEIVYSGNKTMIRRKIFRDRLKDVPLMNGLHQMDSQQAQKLFLNDVPEEYKANKKNAKKVVFDVFKAEEEDGYIKLIKNKKRLNVAIYLEKH